MRNKLLWRTEGGNAQGGLGSKGLRHSKWFLEQSPDCSIINITVARDDAGEARPWTGDFHANQGAVGNTTVIPQVGVDNMIGINASDQHSAVIVISVL